MRRVSITLNAIRQFSPPHCRFSLPPSSGCCGKITFQQMSQRLKPVLLQVLLLRALVARFWQATYTRGGGSGLIRWGTERHAR